MRPALQFSALPAITLGVAVCFSAALKAESGLSLLTQANAALQAGEADKALVLLAKAPTSGEGAALHFNLQCRVHYELGQFDAAANECQRAVQLDEQSSDFHLWLGRAIGERASKASFMSAFSLAKQSRAEFETAVRLNPRNAAALADLGDFYTEAPGVVGGGIDKAGKIAEQLDPIDAGRAHHLRAQMAEQQKDYAGSERELKQAISTSQHPAADWMSLASFYGKRKQFADLDAAIRSGQEAARRDRSAATALYDGATVLIRAKRNLPLAESMLKDYLAILNKSEDAPAFSAHLMLARARAMQGDSAGATQERDAALALASDYKPARDFNPSSSTQDAKAQ